MNSDFITNGPQSAPASGVVLADTGPLVCDGYYGGYYSITVLLNSTLANCSYVLEILDTNGVDVLHSTVLSSIASDAKVFNLCTDIFIENNASIRLSTGGSVASGVVQGSIIYKLTSIN